MEVRKIQKVGYSTLSVSLPKAWTKKMGLSAGDLISFSTGNDGVLKIHPGIAKSSVNSSTCMINADRCEDSNMIVRFITGCYMVGYETITVSSASALDVEVIQEIRDALHNLIGVGMIEQHPSSIMIECFVDPKKFQLDSLLNRQQMVVHSMLEQAINALEKGDLRIVEEIRRMGDETDKIYALLVRQLLLSVEDEEIARSIGIESVKNIVGDRVVFKTIEDIGDAVEMIGSAIGSIIESKTTLDQQLREEIVKLLRKTAELYRAMYSTFASMDIVNANLILNTRMELDKDCMKMEERIADLDLNRSVSHQISKVLWSIHLISKLSETLPEITINRGMESSNDFITAR